MALLVVFFAALVATGATLVIPRAKNLRIRQLAGAYWLAGLAMLAGGFAQGGGLDAFFHVEELGNHAALGIVVVAAIMIVWTVFCLFNGFGRGGER